MIEIEPHSKRIIMYGIIVVVFLSSVLCAFFLPIPDIFRGIFATPAVLAMIGALFQIFRDEAHHQKNLQLQRRDQMFEVAAMSHMANVTFDKHVEFCEKYLQEVHEAASALFRKGPTTDALDYARHLMRLKQEYAAWVSEEITNELTPFEQALREIGSGIGYCENVSGDPSQNEERRKAVKFVWEKFNKVLGIQGEQPDEQVAIEAVKRKVRQILDIEELIKLRKALIYEANQNIKSYYK